MQDAPNFDFREHFNDFKEYFLRQLNRFIWDFKIT